MGESWIKFVMRIKNEMKLKSLGEAMQQARLRKSEWKKEGKHDEGHKGKDKHTRKRRSRRNHKGGKKSRKNHKK